MTIQNKAPGIPIGRLVWRSCGNELARGGTSRYDVTMTLTAAHIAIPWLRLILTHTHSLHTPIQIHSTVAAHTEMHSYDDTDFAFVCVRESEREKEGIDVILLS